MNTEDFLARLQSVGNRFGGWMLLGGEGAVRSCNPFLSPLGAVCRATVGEIHPLSEWEKAAAKLGLPEETARLIYLASELPMRLHVGHPVRSECARIREQILGICGLQEVSASAPA